MEVKEIDVKVFEQEVQSLKSKGFDFLRNMVGVDYTPMMATEGSEEKFLGAVYQFENSTTFENINLKVIAEKVDGEYVIPSITKYYAAANFLEREAYDFIGIIFTGNPDMRRLYLRNDFVGFPLRKDYDMSPENPSNKMPADDDVDTDFTWEYNLTEDGKLLRTEKRVWEPEDYVINIGPQHPATHGVLRYQTALDGENIKKIDVHAGYIHRGIEKICELGTFQQTLAFTDRLDYLSANQNRHALCMCIEQAMGVEVTDRIKYIRTIMDELQRLDSHLLYYSCCGQDLGALTAFIYGMRDREHVLNVMEETTGGRLIQNYNRIGGVQADIDPHFVENVKKLITYLRPWFKEYHDVFGGNVIFEQRFEKVGILSKEDAIAYGCTGGTGRASGWNCDVRKRHPYAMYDKVDFDEIVLNNGDSMDRYLVRIREMEQSLRIIEQLIDNIPEGDFYVKQKPIIKVPEGTYYASVEGSRGEFGAFLISDGSKNPYRIRFRSMGLPLVSAMDHLCRDEKIADLIAISASLDYVVPDIDR